MVVSIKPKGLRDLCESETVRGANPMHASKLRLQLGTLNSSLTVADMDAPGWKLHKLQGFRPERWSVAVDKNWRLTFEFENGNAYVVDFEDYH